MKSKRKPNGYYANIENVLKDCRGFMEEYGYDELPGNNVLREKGRSDLSAGISKHSFPKIRKLLGGREKVKPKGYWTIAENVIRECRDFMEEYGYDELPRSDIIKEKGRSDLVTGISKYSFPKIRKLLGEKQKRKPDGYYANIENVLRECRKFKEEYGLNELPSTEKMREMGRSDLASGIARGEYSFSKIRELLGEGQKRKPDGYYANIENVLRDCREFMEEYKLDELPSARKMREIGRSDLSGGISKHGFPKIRALLSGKEQISEKETLEFIVSKYIGGGDEGI